jgi:alpha,alpha-trehalose phosphorylase
MLPSASPDLILSGLRRYHGDPWRLAERAFDPTPAAESVFALGNGYLGVRGTPDEGTPAHEPGAVLNGFHETWPIVYPEDAYGLARTGQTIVNATDGSILRLAVDDEPLDVTGAQRYERVLDMHGAVLHREVEHRTASGSRVRLRTKRLVSLDDRHLLAIEYELEALDGPVAVALSSELVTHQPDVASDDPRRGKGFAERVLTPVHAEAAGTRATLTLATRNSGLVLACGMDHRIEGPAELEVSAAGDGAELVVLAGLEAGETLRVEKFVAYHWGEDDRSPQVHATLDRATATGFPGVELAHRRHAARFWERADVELEGAPDVQQAVRFNLFQLLQATACGDGLGVAAKGVSGHGYEGHYFWDTEVYVVPFLVHAVPEWARRVLDFRIGKLDAARERAREVGHRGALYPWRTITGQEASAWYASGTAQYHINADIAHALHHYNRVTGDLDFLLGRGAEVMVETARLWLDLGFFSERKGGRFVLNGVTGPDEYTTVVDNNAYTNLMAKQNLEIAVRVTEWLAAADPEAYGSLVEATGLRDEEIAAWRRAAELMYVPRAEVVLQDERFLERERWDLAATPPEKHPLLLHHHPLEIYRHQVIKQTDVVLATYLAADEFGEEETRRTFDYYDPLTTGDSTLSACVQSIVATQVGRHEAAMEYFLRACAVDLLDLHGNTADGIHVASCGGTWLALVAGYGGLRDFDGHVRLQPRLPAGWTRLRFRLEVRGQVLEVDMNPRGTTVTLLEGNGLMVELYGADQRLTPGHPVRGTEPVPLPEAA